MLARMSSKASRSLLTGAVEFRPQRPARPRGRSKPEGGHLDGHFDLPGLCGQRKAPFGAHFQAEHDRFADAFGGLFPGAALADAPRNGWALGHPHPVFIPVTVIRNFIAVPLPPLVRCCAPGDQDTGGRQASVDVPSMPS